jgi:hypothetical protein
MDNIIPKIALNFSSNTKSISKYALMLAVAAQDALGLFGKLVEQNGAWRMLYDFPGKPSHETRHQQLFRLCAHVPFTALGIVSNPGADHGSGPTDLSLTLGKETHIVEFKKDTSKREANSRPPGAIAAIYGLGRRAFRYLSVVCHKGTKDSALGALSGVESRGVVISKFAIDCRAQISASKA